LAGVVAGSKKGSAAPFSQCGNFQMLEQKATADPHHLPQQPKLLGLVFNDAQPGASSLLAGSRLAGKKPEAVRKIDDKSG
jgi:hypothetical protein